MFVFSDKTYNATKKLVQVVLPATAALYYGLAAIWNLPASEQIVGSEAVIATFLGVCLGISSKQYAAGGSGFDGQMILVKAENGQKTYSLVLNGDPQDLEDRDTITFQVKAADAPAPLEPSPTTPMPPVPATKPKAPTRKRK